MHFGHCAQLQHFCKVSQTCTSELICNSIWLGLVSGQDKSVRFSSSIEGGRCCIKEIILKFRP